MAALDEPNRLGKGKFLPHKENQSHEQQPKKKYPLSLSFRGTTVFKKDNTCWLLTLTHSTDTQQVHAKCEIEHDTTNGVNKAKILLLVAIAATMLGW